MSTEHVISGDVDADGVDGLDVDEPAADDPSETTAEPDAKTVDSARATDVRPGRLRRVVSRWRLITVGVLLVASAGVAAGLYFTQYRPDRQTDDPAAKAVIAAASEGTVSLLSYAPDSLGRDLAAAKSHLTGDFLTYYGKFTEQIVAPAAKQKTVKTTASVVRAAVSDLHPDSAKVVVFLNQTTTSKDRPDLTHTASSVVVSLTKVNGTWLISAFDPV
ncbi:MAG: twin-arginine translocation pathway signal [Mycobacterium sp.]|uniref:twin-arginine translocation pathway signal n=1 Tax=Mycobacterium sp. TaxID=1785 RepID=UPI003F9B1E83